MTLTAEWVLASAETHTRAVTHEPVKLTPRGELGDSWAAALHTYRASCNVLTCLLPLAQTGLCCSLQSDEG